MLPLLREAPLALPPALAPEADDDDGAIPAPAALFEGALPDAPSDLEAAEGVTPPRGPTEAADSPAAAAP
jgi:hypothetical protein